MKKKGKQKLGIARLLQIAGKQRYMLFFSGFLAVIHALLSLVPYVLIFYILKELTQPNINYEMTQTYIYYALGAVVLSVIFLYISGIASHISAFNVLLELRRFITKKVGELPLGYLNNRNSGALRKILSDDVERIEIFIAHQIPDLVKAVALPIITIGYLFSIDWRLSLVSLIPLIILVILISILYTSEKNKILMEKYHQSLEDMNAGIVEYVRAMPVMKVFGQSAETFEKFGETVKNFNVFVIKWIRQSTPIYASFMSFMSNAMLPVLALGLYLYFEGGVSLSVFLLFLILGTGYIKPIFALNTMAMQISVINRGVEQMDKLTGQPTLEESDQWQEPKDFSVEFRNVSFAYEENHNVLENINFISPEKSITALVGPSGAGKSTIGQLLARFWDTTEGEILIGGIEIGKYPTKQLMQLVSFVFQDSFMFQQTMYENIRMGMDKTQEEIIAASKAAQIHDLIMQLPNGYNTLFGQLGVHLSGGEQQRFQLARAILKNSPILVLDEATAFADPENEYKIQQAFGELIKDKTVFIIAHRLSTITDADQILLFDKGELKGSGKHNELIENSSIYQRMWNTHIRAKDFTMNN